MLKFFIVALLVISVASCRNQKSPKDTSAQGKPEIVGQLPLGTVNPDEARVRLEVFLLTESGFQAKVIRQEEVGHSFGTILSKGQLINIETSQQELVKGDELIATIERVDSDIFKLLNFY